MEAKAFLCVLIHHHALISCNFPLILGFSRISWQDSWHFLDFLTRFVVFPESFLYQKPFCVFFSRKGSSFFLKFLAKSCKIVHMLGALGKNLVKILTKGFRNFQDSWQEFQDILHWVNWMISCYSVTPYPKSSFRM